MKHSSDIIYGGIDGTITTFAIIAGALGSNQSSNTVIILAIASLLSDGFSMGTSAYESEIINIDNAIIRGIITFIAFVAIGSIPIIVFYLNKNESYNIKRYTTFFATLICLFIIGIFKEYNVCKLSNKEITYKALMLSGTKTLILGAISGIIAYETAKYVNEYVLKNDKKL